jgi:uncharacterized membrane protein
MPEPESLSADESLAAHLARHSYDRLIMLSDGVFAIATTLAALEIRLPAGIRDPEAAFEAMRRPLAAYAISFVVIAIFWASHRDLFARVAKVSRSLTISTLAMLFAVSLIPLGVGGIAANSANAGFRVYAATMTACGVLNAAMWNVAAFSPGVMRADVPKDERLLRAIGSLVMPVIFVPIFITPVDRFTTVVLPVLLVVLIARRRLLPWIIRRKFAVERASVPLAEGAVLPH